MLTPLGRFKHRAAANIAASFLVTVFNGSKLRYKNQKQVVDELEAIYRLGYRGDVFFVDDNFINSPTRSQAILDAMRFCRITANIRFLFTTQTDIKVAADHNVRLVESMVAVGFKAVFVGIETPSAESLASVSKTQNIGVDITKAMERLRTMGLTGYAGYIAGFDPTVRTSSNASSARSKMPPSAWPWSAY